MKAVKQVLIFLLFIGQVTLSLANQHSQLYQVAGWPVQVDHFNNALQEVQVQYKDVLPPMIYQAIVMSSNQRFDSNAMKQRGEAVLTAKLKNPQPALDFFESDLGVKIVKAETRATTKEELKKHHKGVPAIEITSHRKELFKRLAQAIPYNEATVNVTMALTNIASDTVDMWFPESGVGDALKKLTPTKQQIQKQVNTHLAGTLIYVYRDLSDSELEQFINFAESPSGKEYYQVAQDVILASVNK